MSNSRKIEVQVDLGIKQPFEIVSCRIEEGISQTTHALVEVTSMDDLNLESVLTGPAEVLLLLDGMVERRWSLKVGGHRFLSAKGHSLRYEVELFSTEWIMTLTKDTRKYQNENARTIVTAVLGRSSVPFEWRITRTPAERDYCVQYRETNYDFTRRMLEFEGIHYVFDEDGKMILADRSTASSPIPGLSTFDLLEGEGALTDGVEGVHEIRRGSRVQPGKYTVNDFDWKKPHTRIAETRTADRDQPLEIYEYLTGYRDTGEGAVLAQMRLESRRVGAKYVIGKSSVGRFQPAHLFTFGAAASPAFAGEYLLVRVAHRYRNPAFPATNDDGKQGNHIYENDFFAIPREVLYRPLVATPRPNVDGYHTAMVRGPVGEEIHTDKYGRFKVQFHWDREAKGTDEDSRWLRIVQESASSMFLARVGWEMNIGYIDGDPDRPMGLARNINKIMPPAYAQPGKKNVMTIKTPTSPANGGFNEIRLDDTAGAMEFYVKAERDLLNLVKHDRSEQVGMNETRFVGTTLQETVERDQSTTIGANSTTETGGMRELVVKHDRKDRVGGTESIDVSEGMTVKVHKDETEKVGGTRHTHAGKSINRKGKDQMTRLVGGAIISNAQGNISTSANYGFTEVVGGAKMTVAAEGKIQQSVSGPLATTVMGSVTRQSGQDMSYSAENSFITVDATADLKSDEKLTIESDSTIEMVAEEEMKLTVGGVSITMTPGQVRFTGDLHFKTSGKIAITGKPDNVTK